MIKLFGKTNAEKISSLDRRIKMAMIRKEYWDTRINDLVKAKVDFRLEMRKKWEWDSTLSILDHIN